MTEREIAKEFYLSCSPKERDFLFSDTQDWEHSFARSSAMRWIRNYYNLWTDSELTKSWRSGEDVSIIDGVDMSTSHPDEVSHRIFMIAASLHKAGLV